MMESSIKRDTLNKLFSDFRINEKVSKPDSQVPGDPADPSDF